MSTGAECNLTEVEPGRWTYRLQQYPYGETQDYDEFGPFGSFKSAYEHLHDNHANPGGFSTRIHETDHRHEWGIGMVQTVVGYTLSVDVESLGPDASREEVIALVQSLPPDHPAIHVGPKRGWEDKERCEACHLQRAEVVSSR